MGKGVIIGVGAMDTKDIPAWCLALGSHAKVVKISINDVNIQKMNGLIEIYELRPYNSLSINCLM